MSQAAFYLFYYFNIFRFHLHYRFQRYPCSHQSSECQQSGSQSANDYLDVKRHPGIFSNIFTECSVCSAQAADLGSKVSLVSSPPSLPSSHIPHSQHLEPLQDVLVLCPPVTKVFHLNKDLSPQDPHKIDHRPTKYQRRLLLALDL